MMDNAAQPDARNIEAELTTLEIANTLVEKPRQTKAGKNQTPLSAVQIKQPEGQTEPLTGQTKVKKNQTDNVKWSIFTEAETKVSAGKAAKKAGLKLNEWIDQTLRQAAIDELTKKAQPPAKPEDLVADIVKQFADQMQASNAATVEQQNDLIKAQGQQIAALAKAINSQPPPPPPPSLKELIFGRSNKP